jgi:hypothetical protein
MCPTPDDDPDCPWRCGADGVCVPEGCAVRDPDCGDGPVGAACDRDSDCAHGRCVRPGGGAALCTKRCSASDPCPDGLGCDRQGQLCLPAAASGCAAGGGGGAAAIAVLLALLVARLTRSRVVSP